MLCNQLIYNFLLRILQFLLTFLADKVCKFMKLKKKRIMLRIK